MRLKIEAKTIVSKANIRREAGLGVGVGEFVAHVDEIGLAGANAAGCIQSALDGEMRLV